MGGLTLDPGHVQNWLNTSRICYLLSVTQMYLLFLEHESLLLSQCSYFNKNQKSAYVCACNACLQILMSKQWQSLAFKNSHWLHERPGSLDIMGTQVRAPFKPLSTIVLWYMGGFKGAFNWAPVIPRDVSLSESCTSDRCCFSSLEACQSLPKVRGLIKPVLNLSANQACSRPRGSRLSSTWEFN